MTEIRSTIGTAPTLTLTRVNPDFGDKVSVTLGDHTVPFDRAAFLAAVAAECGDPVPAEITTAEQLGALLAAAGEVAEPVVLREGFRIWTLTEDDRGTWWAWSWREEGEDDPPHLSTDLRLPLTVVYDPDVPSLVGAPHPAAPDRVCDCADGPLDLDREPLPDETCGTCGHALPPTPTLATEAAHAARCDAYEAGRWTCVKHGEDWREQCPGCPTRLSDGRWVGPDGAVVTGGGE